MVKTLKKTSRFKQVDKFSQLGLLEQNPYSVSSERSVVSIVRLPVVL